MYVSGALVDSGVEISSVVLITEPDTAGIACVEAISIIDATTGKSSDILYACYGSPHAIG